MPDQQILASYRDFLYGVDMRDQGDCVYAYFITDGYGFVGEFCLETECISVDSTSNSVELLQARLAAEKIRRAVDKFIEGLDKAEALSRWEGK